MHSEPCLTSKMVRFGKIGNGYYSWYCGYTSYNVLKNTTQNYSLKKSTKELKK